MKRDQLKLEEVADAVLSRLTSFRQFDDHTKARVLAQYCLDLIDAVLADAPPPALPADHRPQQTQNSPPPVSQLKVGLGAPVSWVSLKKGQRITTVADLSLREPYMAPRDGLYGIYVTTKGVRVVPE